MSADTQRVYPPTHLGAETPADAERKNGQSVGRATQLLVLEVRRAAGTPIRQNVP